MHALCMLYNNVVATDQDQCIRVLVLFFAAASKPWPASKPLATLATTTAAATPPRSMATTMKSSSSSQRMWPERRERLALALLVIRTLETVTGSSLMGPERKTRERKCGNNKWTDLKKSPPPRLIRPMLRVQISTGP